MDIQCNMSSTVQCTHSLSRGRAKINCDSLLLTTGQRPILVASKSTTGESIFAGGVSTAKIGQSYLPECAFSGLRTSFLELKNMNTSIVVGESGPYDMQTDMSVAQTMWNTATYDVLNSSFSGLYSCNTDKSQSASSWKLSVIGTLLPEVTNANTTIPASRSLYHLASRIEQILIWILDPFVRLARKM